MTAAVSMLCSISLAAAQRIVATEPRGTERYALANTIISLHTTNRANEEIIDGLLAECAEKRAEIDALRGVIR